MTEELAGEEVPAEPTEEMPKEADPTKQDEA